MLHRFERGFKLVSGPPSPRVPAGLRPLVPSHAPGAAPFPFAEPFLVEPLRPVRVRLTPLLAYLRRPLPAGLLR